MELSVKELFVPIEWYSVRAVVEIYSVEINKLISNLLEFSEKLDDIAKRIRVVILRVDVSEYFPLLLKKNMQ